MAKTGTEQTTWTSLTSGVQFSVNSVFDMTPLRFGYTDLAPFKNFSENYITSLNLSLVTLRSYTEADVAHMNKAAENKVNDDSAGASGIRGGGGM